MAKQLKPITIKEVIKWLKQVRITEFSYYNENKGCLFSRFMQYKTGDERATALNGGNVRVNERFYPDIIPFHNEFWEPSFGTASFLPITRKQAIVRLEAMQELQTMRKKTL